MLNTNANTFDKFWYMLKVMNTFSSDTGIGLPLTKKIN